MYGRLLLSQFSQPTCKFAAQHLADPSPLPDITGGDSGLSQLYRAFMAPAPRQQAAMGEMGTASVVSVEVRHAEGFYQYQGQVKPGFSFAISLLTADDAPVRHQERGWERCRCDTGGRSEGRSGVICLLVAEYECFCFFDGRPTQILCTWSAEQRIRSHGGV